MEFHSTFNHPLCGCASIVIQKNYLSIYNKVVQAILQKGKVIYGEERKFTRTYEMDVQISYRCDLRSLLEVRACAITSIRDIPTTKCLVSDERCEAVGQCG